ncbi:hypothetical protein [Bradyrhizobium sp. BWC-3-1]|uniref:hypothetical protein n=1 Tax=Bradyrhizobium sp. BWC-3-1 TaxID=3080012 RepID=UPI00293F6E55|nr:hypothetical protein [Bradyrhizobium sp. BWC-3-1]WOH56104.1 hypothetical protein RX329_28045 [Bradyrhizobium sp. BWC-3-1]
MKFAGVQITRTTIPTGHDTMNQEVNTAAIDTQTPAPRQGSDLLGGAFLATAGVIMTAWIGGLIWGAAALVIWVIT